MVKTKYLKRRTKNRKTKNKRIKRGGAAAENVASSSSASSSSAPLPGRKSRGIKEVVKVTIEDKLSSITKVFHTRLSEEPLPENIEYFQISDIRIPVNDTKPKTKTIYTNASGNQISLYINFYEQPPYFYKKMVFDVTNVGIHDCDHQIVLFLNELQINSIASKLMDQCSFITPIPSGYHFSVTPEGIVTFIIRMQYVDLSKTSDVTHEDFPQIKRITDCLSKNGKIHHGDLANRNVRVKYSALQVTRRMKYLMSHTYRITHQ